MNYLLFNSHSKNGNNEGLREKVHALFEGQETKDLDVIGLNADEFLASLKPEDDVTIIGGDGTFNHFINDVDTDNLPCKFYFYPGGTGNDLFNDLKDHVENGRLYVNEIVKNLPIVIVNGKTSKFINGIGFGIDGYCCEVGDELQAKSDKPVNYTSIAIKGLLFHYKAPNAKVTVDGVTKEYKRVWFASAMKGRFYGGGMMVAPDQNRFEEERLVTSAVMHKSGKIKTLMVFPSIFKGEHVKHTEMVDIRKGHDIKVEFDRPTALQIDGETVKNVLSYEVHIK